MAATVVDTIFLAGYLGIAQPILQQAIDAPTTELVNAVLAAVQAKAREHQELEADKHQVDTELETAVLNSETRSKDLKEAAEKATKKADELREKLSSEGMHSVLAFYFRTLTTWQRTHALLLRRSYSK